MMVALDAVPGVGLLGLLASRFVLPVLRRLAFLAGLAGAKVYYNVQSSECRDMFSFAGL